MHRFTPLAALAVISGFAHAGGTLTVYDSRLDFDAAVVSQQTETFEGETLGLFSMPTTFGSGLSADLINGSVSSLIEAGDPDGYGFHNTTDGGRKYLRLGMTPVGAGQQTGSYTVEFTFGGASSAFGFDLSGFQPGGAAGGFNLTLLSNGMVLQDVFVPSDQLNTDVRFFGFVNADSFDAVRVNIPVLNTDSVADYVAFDDVSWGVVPAPSSLSLLALGTAVAARRRR